MKQKKHYNINDILIIVFDFARLILLSCIIGVLLLTFITRKMEVIGPSMYPTLEEGESVFINMAANYIDDINRFDVVVARNKTTKDLWVKRVIGLPNEVIEYKNDQLYVDGKLIKEDFFNEAYVARIKAELQISDFTHDYRSKKLGKDEYLLIGDNRNSSLDSRNEAVGPFKREQIIAKGVLVILPLSKVRYVS